MVGLGGGGDEVGFGGWGRWEMWDAGWMADEELVVGRLGMGWEEERGYIEERRASFKGVLESGVHFSSSIVLCALWGCG